MPYEKFSDGTKKDLSEEIPFELPQGWMWARLGDVFNHNTGKALNRNKAEGVLREYITTSNVYWDEFKLDELKQMPFTDEELNKCTVRKGDLLVCEGGDIGRAAIWNFNKEVCIQNHLHRLRAYSEVCVPYFCFVLRLYKATNRLQGKGIGLQGFSSGMLHNLIVPLPPLAEQKRIVAKVEKLFAYADQIGSASEEITKTAQRLDKKILDLAIRGKLVPQDPNDEPASELVKRIEEQRQAKIDGKKSRAAASHKPTYEIEPPFDIPESWKWVKLSDLGSFVGGHTPSLSDASNWADGDILWVTSKDMKQKYISDTGCKVSKKGASELHLLPKGSLIMVTRSGILRRTFPIAIASKPLTINQDQRAIEFYDSEMSEYIYCCLKSLEPIILRDYRKTGTTVESIIWDKFIHIPIPLPPLAEQKRIVKKIDELKEMTQALVAL